MFRETLHRFVHVFLTMLSKLFVRLIIVLVHETYLVLIILKGVLSRFVVTPMIISDSQRMFDRYRRSFRFVVD